MSIICQYQVTKWPAAESLMLKFCDQMLLIHVIVVKPPFTNFCEKRSGREKDNGDKESASHLFNNTGSNNGSVRVRDSKAPREQAIGSLPFCFVRQTVTIRRPVIGNFSPKNPFELKQSRQLTLQEFIYGFVSATGRKHSVACARNHQCSIVGANNASPWKQRQNIVNTSLLFCPNLRVPGGRTIKRAGSGSIELWSHGFHRRKFRIDQVPE